MPTDIPTDPGPYAAFIARYLMQPVAPGSAGPRAAAETEAAVGGDRWFWADDNAKVLEFLTLPAVWHRHPRDVADAFRFLASLCHGPFILRRRGHPRLEAVSNEGGRARFAHTFMSIDCDLPKGVVQVGMRFHDGRNARNLTFTGNHVEFVHDGVRRTLDVEDAIVACDVRHGDGRLRLWHASELHFDHGGRRLRLGRLTYAYGFDERSMAVDAEVALDLDPGVAVSGVVLTIGHDDLSHGQRGVNYGVLHAELPGRPPSAPLRLVAGEPSQRRHPAPGAAYWCLAQQESMRGFALGIHSLPREPERVSAFRVAGRIQDRLHWVASEHLFPAPARGARLVAAERKWITSGGFYDRVSDCAGLLRDHDAAPGAGPLDLSVSYDYGAELGAFARCLRGLSGDGPSDARLRDEARFLYDRYLDVYAENLLGAHRGGDPGAVFSRPLAFVALSLVDMLAATGEARYREMLREAMDVLLAFQRAQADVAGEPSAVFLMGQSGGSAVPFMDCHSAALLALVRAVPVLEDPRFAAALDLGLGAYCLATLRFELGRLRSKQDMVGVDFVDSAGKRRTMGGEWNFCSALTLRAFKALRRSRHPAIQAVEEKHRDRLRLLAAVMHDQIRRSLRPREGGALEVRTSVLSGEGNSETQPWAALALVEDASDD